MKILPGLWLISITKDENTQVSHQKDFPVKDTTAPLHECQRAKGSCKPQ